jgi:Probable addiction module antidote protein
MGLSREQLYRFFSENGNPTLRTTIAVMKALGMELTAKPHLDRPGGAWMSDSRDAITPLPFT